MSTTKQPKLFISTGADARAFRKKFGLNQRDFWSRVQVTQSGGSRYESGREMPASVSLLLNIAYGSEKQAQAILQYLREPADKK